MKTLLVTLKTVPLVVTLTLLSVLATQIGSAATDKKLRRFQNTDKSKSFMGTLKSYSPKHKRVGVRLKNGRVQLFDIKHLCKEDQDYVLSQSKRLAIQNHVEVTATKFTEKPLKSGKGSSQERTYPTGYRITVDNRSEEMLPKLEVNYTIYYGVQGYDASSRETKTEQGSLTFMQVEPRRDLTLDSSVVDIVSGKKAEKVKTNNRNNRNNATRTKRRKDVIYGCKMDVLLDGKVIKSFTEGTIKDD